MSQSELIQKIIDYYAKHDNNTCSMAEFIDEELERIRKIKKDLDNLYNNEAQFRNSYNAQMRIVQEAKQDIQLMCPHYLISKSGDPSGGTDRSNYCQTCFKEMN